MSTYEIDPNKIIVGLAKESLAEVSKKFDAQIRRAFQNAKLGLSIGLDKYATQSISYYDSVRTIIHRDSASLNAVYAPMRLSRFHLELADDEFFDNFDGLRRCVIIGTAGSGKSFLLRKLFIDLFRRPHATIPIFLELRRIDPNTYDSLEAEIRTAASRLGLRMEEDTFGDLHARGRLAFFLDGFDELAPKLRRKVEDDIDRLVQLCPKNWVIITSRPDTRFAGWSRFSEFAVKPFSVDQVRELIVRTPVPADLKQRFCTALSEGLYEARKDILSIPLFAYVMLMVYEDYSDVPEDITLFYRFAFETLFIRHDATKLGYTRHRYTKLTLDQFERALGAFSFLSFMQGRISFSEADLIATARKALMHEQLATDPEAFLTELMETVCVLHRDGTDTTFTHRTFQEYFAAHYIVLSGKVDLPKALAAVHDTKPQSELVRFALGLARGPVVDQWLSKALRKILGSPSKGKDVWARILRARFTIKVRQGHWSISANGKEWRALVRLVQHLQPLPITEGSLAALIGSKARDSFLAGINADELVPHGMIGLSHSARMQLVKGNDDFDCLIAPFDEKWLRVLGLFQRIESDIQRTYDVAENLLQESQERAQSIAEIDELFSEAEE